ncbi:MAG: phosphate ABC transporter permease subunit PstC [Chloroflexi bacterium]|nr:phosphate ABC transporter permease subunit PstC [Chloroflexota bacterium]
MASPPSRTSSAQTARSAPYNHDNPSDPPDFGTGGTVSLRWGDFLFQTSSVAAAASILVVLAALFVLLVVDSRESLVRYGIAFATSSVWDNVKEQFGALPYIYGTLVTSAVALVLAGPIAVGAALYVAEYAPAWIRTPVSFTIELLAAIPSIIYGLWGFFVLTPVMRTTVEPALQRIFGPIPVVGILFQGAPIGKDLLTGGVILAIMIVPTIMAISREVILAVPPAQREGMLALGATRWESLRHAVLPYARAGIAGAAILGLARALGETMAVTMVIGNSSRAITGSLFTPGYTMASAIANQFTEADTAIYFSAIVEVALVLLLVSIAVNIVARLLVWQIGRGDPAALGGVLV